MDTNTTFGNCDQQLNEILSSNLPEKVLLVPADFAKKSHTVKFCFANGKYLRRKPLIIKNNIKGANFLSQKIEQCCATRKIKKQHVIIAIEDPHSYAKDFFFQMQDKGYFVVQVNALKAKNMRNNGMASNDNLDLDGIANAVINRKAVPLKGRDQVYQSLKQAERTYDNLIKECTRQKNRIDKLVDQTFPGLLDEKKSGLTSWSRACMALMKKGITPESLKRLGRNKLIAQLKKYHVNDAAGTADKLLNLASESLSIPGELRSHLSELLKIQVTLFEHLQEAAESALSLAKKLLLQTPYCLAISIPGIAEVRGVTMAGELGPPEHLEKASSLCAFVGVVPKSAQTGGPDKAPVDVGMPRKCNRRLKKVFIDAAHDQGTYLHPAGREIPQAAEHRFYRHYHQVESRGGKSGISTARVMVRVIRRMVKNHAFYLPEEQVELTPIEQAIYAEVSLARIYKTIGKATFKAVPREKNFLVKIAEEWKTTLKELAGIELNLPF